MTTFQTGGLERVVERLALTGRDFGIRSTAFAYVEPGELQETFERQGIDTVFLPTRSGVRCDLGPRLARELRRRSIDVLHSHHLGPYLYGSVAATLARIPHVTTEHSREAYDTGRRRILGRSMSTMAHVVTVSEELAGWRSRRFGSRPEVILNGVPVPTTDDGTQRRAARAHFARGNEFTVGCVARFAPEKDHATMLRAFRGVVDQTPDARLVLIGWGPEEQALMGLTRDLGLSDNVTNLGRRDDVEQLVHGFDVVSLTSRREGLPLALLEGMAAGVPAVGTAVGEIERMLEGQCGIVVAPGDAEELTDAYLVYLNDTRRRRRDGDNARRRVQDRYSAVRMTASYVRIYRDVTSGKTSNRARADYHYA